MIAHNGMLLKRNARSISLAILVLAVSSCGHSEWYRMGFDAGKDAVNTKHIYEGELTPAAICRNNVLNAKLSGASEGEGSEVYDGCMAGLRDLLGKSEFDRVSRGAG